MPKEKSMTDLSIMIDEEIDAMRRDPRRVHQSKEIVNAIGKKIAIQVARSEIAFRHGLESDLELWDLNGAKQLKSQKLLKE